MLLELAVYMRQMRRLTVIDLRANPICATPGYKDVVINTFPILLSLDAEELDPVVQHAARAGGVQLYMRQMWRLIVIDLRANPICATPGYKDVVINTFPILLSLDAEELDPVVQRSYKMDMTPDINTFATRRLLRLLYIEQLSRAHVSPHTPPADTTEIPLVVLVGCEAVGKGTLARRLVEECSAHIELGYLHTTAPYHFPNRYREVSRSKFDDMLLAGDFLTYSEMDGESYGLSREEAFINEGKVKVVCMDLIGALMLKSRGLRPYLILVTRLDKRLLLIKQKELKTIRNINNEHRMSLEPPLERSTLQVLLSGRIIITGILNEILLYLPEEKEKSEFVIESECSLMMDSEARQAAKAYARGFNMITLLASSTTSIDDACKDARETSQMEPSLYSLYKESQGTDEYNSYANGQNSYQERNARKEHADSRPSRTKNDKPASISRPKSVDFSRYASSTWKGFSVVPDSSKSSKSVTFTSQENEAEDKIDPSGMLIEPRHLSEKEGEKNRTARSISGKVPWKSRRTATSGSGDDLDLWLAFLLETGLLQASSITRNLSDVGSRYEPRLVDDPESIIRQLADYLQVPCETYTTNIRDEYEDIHRKSPGLFWDTVTTDNPNEAFIKVKGIIHNIFNSQPNLKPMFDIDFANLNDYPTVEKKLDRICKEIAPQRLFY
ncbi:uncharacterized protein LOC135078651 [Ostrinia nubilalis]|uniref:uncharacterized protein LOC135078651 n=1 Tax=Ostrinia nubilalis TaxID=29057 RepID=UPI0030823F14